MMTHYQSIKPWLVQYIQQQRMQDESFDVLLRLLQTATKDEDLVGLCCEKLRCYIERKTSIVNHLKNIGARATLMTIADSYERNDRVMGNICRILSLMFPLQ